MPDPSEYRAEANKFVIKDDISLRYVETVSRAGSLMYAYRTGKKVNKRKEEFLKHFYGLYEATLNHLQSEDRKKMEGCVDFFFDKSAEVAEILKFFRTYKALMFKVGLIESGRERRSDEQRALTR